MSTSLFDGDIILMCLTFLSMIDSGRSNSSTMHNGIAPPQGFALSNFLSKSQVLIPALASIYAAHEPLGPPPITATLNIWKKNNTVYKNYIFFAYKSAFLKIIVNIEISFPNSLLNIGTKQRYRSIWYTTCQKNLPK